MAIVSIAALAHALRFIRYRCRFDSWLLLVTCIVVGQLPSAESACAQLPQENIRRIVMLRSDERGTCATGLIVSADTVLLNAHVARRLCPNADCNGVSVLRARALAELPVLIDATVRYGASFPALDLAELHLSPLSKLEPLRGAVDAEIQVQRFMTAHTPHTLLGFPGCTALQESRGVILGLSPVGFESSAQSQYGGSGSAAIGLDGRLLGLVSGANLSAEFLWKFLTGQPFSVAAARLDVWETLRAAPEEQRILGQIELLLEYYRSSSTGCSTYACSILRRIDFLSRVDGLQQSLKAEGKLGPGSPWESLSRAADASFTVPAGHDQFRKLLYLVQWETNGGPSSLEHGADSAAQLAYEDFRAARAQGYAPPTSSVFAELGVAALPLLLVAMVLLLAWALSMRRVFRNSQGSIAARVTAALLVGLLFWPFSYLMWCWTRSERTGSTAKGSAES